MSVEKMSISFDPKLAKTIKREARLARMPVSQWMARAAEREAKLAKGRRLLAEYESEHGRIPDEVRKAVDKLWPV